MELLTWIVLLAGAVPDDQEGPGYTAVVYIKKYLI